MLAKTTNQLMANRITLCWMISVSSVQTNWQSLLVCIFQEAFLVVRQWSISFQNHQSLQQNASFWQPVWPCISWLKKVKTLQDYNTRKPYLRKAWTSLKSVSVWSGFGWLSVTITCKGACPAAWEIVDSNIFSPNNCNLANLLTFWKLLKK